MAETLLSLILSVAIGSLLTGVLVIYRALTSTPTLQAFHILAVGRMLARLGLFLLVLIGLSLPILFT